MIINITIADKRPTVEGAPVIVCGNSDYSIKFNFDAEWTAGAYKTARFVYVRDGHVQHEDRDFTGSTVAVPVLYDVRRVCVGVFMGEISTTTPAIIPCTPSILCRSGDPANPTPEKDARIMQLLNLAVSQQASAKKDAAAAAASAAEAAAIAGALGGDKANALTASVVANPAQFYPDEGSVLRPYINLAPIQDGSGDPSPDNIRPITGYSSLRLVRCGANLLNMAELQGRSGTLVEHLEDAVRIYTPEPGTYKGAGLPSMVLRKGVKYTLTARVAELTSGVVRACFRLAKTTSSGKANEVLPSTTIHFTEPGVGSATFTLSRDLEAYFCALVTWDSAIDGDVTFADIQLTVGAASDYEPYRGDAFDIALGRTVYGGQLVVKTGTLMLSHVLETFDGTEEWMEVTDASGRMRFFKSLPGYDAGLGSIISDRYRQAESWNDHVANVNTVALYRDAGWATARYSINPGFSSEAEWKAYLAEQYAAGTPVQVCYALAATQAVELSPLLVPALDGLNSVYCEGDMLNVVHCKSLDRAFEEVLERLAALEGAAIE